MTKRIRNVSAVCALFFVCVLLAEDLPAQAAMPSLFSKRSMNRDRTDAPTVIEAATMDIDIEKNMATLLGNVSVDDQDLKITCNKMIIYLEDKEKDEESADAKKNGGFTPGKETSEEDEITGSKQISRIECFGDVVITNRAKEDSKDGKGAAVKGKDGKARDQVVTSDKAVYDFKKEEITLTGRPVLTSGTDRLDADKVVIELKTGRAKIYQGTVTYYGDTAMPGSDKQSK